MKIYPILIFILFFILLYHALRRIYYVIVRIFFTQFLDGKVTFQPGISFFSIQNICIQNNDSKITCLMCLPNVMAFGSVKIKKLKVENLKLENKIFKVNTFLKDRNLIKNFGKIEIDELEICKEDVDAKILGLKISITDSFLEICFEELKLENPCCNITIGNSKASIHSNQLFIPDILEVYKPDFSFKTNGNEINLLENKIVAFAKKSSSSLKLTLSCGKININSKKIKLQSSEYIVNFSGVVKINLLGNKFNFDYVECYDIKKLFYLKAKSCQSNYKIIHVKEYYMNLSKKLIDNINVNLSHLTNLIFDKIDFNFEVDDFRKIHFVSQSFEYDSDRIKFEKSCFNFITYNNTHTIIDLTKTLIETNQQKLSSDSINIIVKQLVLLKQFTLSLRLQNISLENLKYEFKIRNLKILGLSYQKVKFYNSKFLIKQTRKQQIEQINQDPLGLLQNIPKIQLFQEIFSLNYETTCSKIIFSSITSYNISTNGKLYILSNNNEFQIYGSIFSKSDKSLISNLDVMKIFYYWNTYFEIEKLMLQFDDKLYQINHFKGNDNHFYFDDFDEMNECNKIIGKKGEYSDGIIFLNYLQYNKYIFTYAKIKFNLLKAISINAMHFSDETIEADNISFDIKNNVLNLGNVYFIDISKNLFYSNYDYDQSINVKKIIYKDYILSDVLIHKSENNFTLISKSTTLINQQVNICFTNIEVESTKTSFVIKCYELKAAIFTLSQFYSNFSILPLLNDISFRCSKFSLKLTVNLTEIHHEFVLDNVNLNFGTEFSFGCSSFQLNDLLPNSKSLIFEIPKSSNNYILSIETANKCLKVDCGTVNLYDKENTKFFLKAIENNVPNDSFFLQSFDLDKLIFKKLLLNLKYKNTKVSSAKIPEFCFDFKNEESTYQVSVLSILQNIFYYINNYIQGESNPIHDEYSDQTIPKNHTKKKFGIKHKVFPNN